MKFKKWWVNAVPTYVRELFYMGFGTGVVLLISYIHPVASGYLLVTSILLGIMWISTWFGDLLKLCLEPKYLDSAYGIPLRAATY